MKKKTLITISMIMALSSCATDIKSTSYSTASIGEASFTYQGIVINVRKIKVSDTDKLGQNQAGTTIGGIGGAAVGNILDNGGLMGTLIGAVAGGVGGAMVEQQLGTQEGMEYVIKLTNAQVLTVCQGLDTNFQVGQHVMVIVSHDGRSRVIADSSPVQEVQTPITPSVIIKKNR